MGARSETKALQAIKEIKEELPDADIRYIHIDLSSLKSVVEAARAIRENEPSLHGLINNAGIMGVPFERTVDGYESQFQTNYLSHWLLTHHLLPLLLSTAKTTGSGTARVVNVTSDGHARMPPKEGIRFDDVNLESESAMTRYCQSKLANVLHARELNRRYGPQANEQEFGEIWFAAVHPGHIDTQLNNQATGALPSIVLRTLTPIMRCVGILDEQAKGAWSSLFAIASKDFDRTKSGSYVVPYAKIGTPSAKAQDFAMGDKLWTFTIQELNKKGFLAEI